MLLFAFINKLIRYSYYARSAKHFARVRLFSDKLAACLEQQLSCCGDYLPLGYARSKYAGRMAVHLAVDWIGLGATHLCRTVLPPASITLLRMATASMPKHRSIQYSRRQV